MIITKRLSLVVKIELDLNFMKTKLLAKFYWNKSRHFLGILITETQTESQTNKQTDSQTHTSKTIPLFQTKFGAR